MNETADTKTRSRKHERTVQLAADPQTVWQAITDPEILPRWFPMESGGTPGEGGELVYGWGPEMKGTVPILAWEPGKHLRTGWQTSQAAGSETAATLVVDWFLEPAAGGGTTLRLVHSGFGADGAWDEEFHGTNRGWNIELMNLVQYLRLHQGKQRRLIGLRQPVPADPAVAWNKAFGEGGFRFGGSGEPPAAGERFELTLPDGERLAGEVRLVNEPFDFCGTLESHGDSVFRFSHESCFGRPEAFVWVSTWGLPQADGDALEERLRRTLERVFG